MKQIVELKYCRRCGRRLKNEASKGVGMGPTCYARYLSELSFVPRLFEVKQHEQQTEKETKG